MNDGSEQQCPSEEMTNEIKKAKLEETAATCPAVAENNLSTSHIGGSNDAVDNSSRESIPSPMVSQGICFIWKYIPVCYAMPFGISSAQNSRKSDSDALVLGMSVESGICICNH